MPFTQTALALIGLLLAAWTLLASFALIAVHLRERRGAAGRLGARRLARMIDESPALPLLVRADGRIEAPQRLAQWLGLDRVPQFLTELEAPDSGLPPDQLRELTDAVRRTQKTAAPFRMVLTPRGSRRSLALRGHLADPQVSPGGAALVWVFDFSDSESELMQLRKEAARANQDFAALVALIEAAPLAMWFRSADGRLRLVNSAYVAAVGAVNAEDVVAGGVELIETVDGKSAMQVALDAATRGQTIERQVMVTIDGQRRAFRVKDLPLRSEGIAGYAMDMEELEQQARSFDAFRRAQRSMLDHLSAGVAQFDRQRQLVFANRPFQSMFAFESADLQNPPSFDQLLIQACENHRVPEARDFKQWRLEHGRWFEAADATEEAWPLPDGTHLRVVGEPVPDGGMLLIVEDRTEQLRISAMRDTLLRTRAATFDSLYESVAAFAPNGQLQLWNRRFAQEWDIDSAFLDTHPHIEDFVRRIAPQLEAPDKATSLGDAVRMATLDRITMGGRIAMADGRRLEYAGVPLPDGNGLLTVLDVTDTDKAEQALRERNAALQEADAIRARVLAELSREFRMPLDVIGGFAERLQAGIGGKLDDTGADYVAAILASVDRIGEHINRLLDLSRVEVGKPTPRPERIELTEFAAQLVEKRRLQISAAGIELDLRDDGSAGVVRGDGQRLARAVGTLLDHAIATTPPGGRILFEVSRLDDGERDRARIVVSDNGPGMDEGTLARTLACFAGSSGDPGDSLGLPLARHIIEAHGGEFELLSEPGQGTAAIITLP